MRGQLANHCKDAGHASKVTHQVEDRVDRFLNRLHIGVNIDAERGPIEARRPSLRPQPREVEKTQVLLRAHEQTLVFVHRLPLDAVQVFDHFRRLHRYPGEFRLLCHLLRRRLRLIVSPLIVKNRNELVAVSFISVEIVAAESWVRLVALHHGDLERLTRSRLIEAIQIDIVVLLLVEAVPVSDDALYIVHVLVHDWVELGRL